jgi:hypothetical protein
MITQAPDVQMRQGEPPSPDAVRAAASGVRCHHLPMPSVYGFVVAHDESRRAIMTLHADLYGIRDIFRPG